MKGLNLIPENKVSAPQLLIIDDDPSVLESLGIYLEDAGFSVVLKPDGESGIEALKKGNVSCVLTDLRMPGLSGIDVIKAVAKWDPDIPVIVISGTDDINGVTESFRLGAWDYILKPIEDLALLEHRINGILEKSLLAEENRHYQESLETLVEERTSQLNETVDNLRETEVLLKNANSDLEEKVSERTRHLQKAISEIARNDRIMALNRLVSGISHEVNTPLGVSVSGITFIKEHLQEYREGRILNNDLNELMESCIKAADLIYENLTRTDVLMKQFQEISTGRSRKDAQIVDLDKLLVTIGDEVDEELRSAGLTLHLECPSQLRFLSYPMSIIQVLKGLLRNSLDHGFPELGFSGGRILISAFLKNNICCIEYSDNGIGMDNNTLRRIYDPFFTTSDDSEHSGLGMSIIYNTVTDGLGGTIECSSRYRKGFTCNLNFPIPENL